MPTLIVGRTHGIPMLMSAKHKPGKKYPTSSDKQNGKTNCYGVMAKTGHMIMQQLSGKEIRNQAHR